ncbi:erythromycin esterase family protein [Bacillus sonorensis]|uniref:erythromycin esterase family protein n=1 Tax=Bacillus sonorensis TaxID=119858 RepID=UPI0022804CE0|nr:erythromycin esterase family protein [Bacillus sonorensis]MCY7857198.1 erythromycin esterase family protein [Bacillus sonorensis]MCY8086646.1 erythromycin esterase family protein [Bacillus sonorensis]
MNDLFDEIRDESINIGEDNGYKFDFFKEILGNKRFVFLGESSHCVKEYSEAKVSLIKFLHQELGFHILAFESELGDCAIGNYLSEELSSKEYMSGSIGRVWQNEFMLDLFEYMKETQQRQPLHLTGVDVQQRMDKHFSSYMRSHLTGDLRKMYVEFDTRTNEMLDKDYILKRRFRKTVEEIEGMGQELMKGLEKQTFPSAMLRDVVLQTMKNRINYFKANFTKGFSKLFEYRDELMAKNLEFLSQHVYPDEKFIIWAHNLHIKKQSSANRFSPYRSFVENLPSSMKEDSFVIGFYAGEGRMGNHQGGDHPIKKVNKKHLEWLLSNSPYQNFFIPCTSRWGGNKWKALEGGGLRISFKPVQQYDGVLFFKKVTPANFNFD